MSDYGAREQFEVWYRGQPIGSLTRAWDAWLASRAAALEEAGKMCEAFNDKQRRGDFALGADYCADAIRALLATPAGGAR